MDWRSFIASLVGSLAWPVIVGALVYLLRDDLPALIRRIKNASLAGTKIEFSDALDKLRQEREVSAVENSARDVGVEIEPRRLELAQRFPEAAVMESYKSVEALLLEARGLLDLPPRSNLLTVVRRLVERGDLDGETEVLFRTLQVARNAAAHAGNQGTRISPGEAVDFMEQASFFQGLLTTSLTKLRSH
jgi:hypothetical protein